MQLKEKEETRGSKGVSPLALQKQTCQKLRTIQVKGLAIQGKTKNCTITNMQKKGKRNKYRLAIEGKRINTGVQGGVPLSAAETNLSKATQGKTKNCTRKKHKRGWKGVSS